MSLNSQFRLKISNPHVGMWYHGYQKRNPVMGFENFLKSINRKVQNLIPGTIVRTIVRTVTICQKYQ
jgi:hypothetical protein